MKLTDPVYEDAAQRIAEATVGDKEREYLLYECGKLCVQAAVYMRAVEIVDGVEFGQVDNFELTGPGPGDEVN
jgi:hypothetical protein